LVRGKRPTILSISWEICNKQSPFSVILYAINGVGKKDLTQILEKKNGKEGGNIHEDQWSEQGIFRRKGCIV
jgi:hypothetical protein